MGCRALCLWHDEPACALSPEQPGPNQASGIKGEPDWVAPKNCKLLSIV